MIDFIPVFKALVDRFIVGFDFVNTDTLTKAGRLYGIGAALDVAGTRFSVTLVIIAMMLRNLSGSRYYKYMWAYFAAFFFVAVVGNMMARTTIVGVVVAIAFLLVPQRLVSSSSNYQGGRVLKYLLVTISIVLPIVVYLYSVNEQFHDNIRFAFEGFFSLAERGHWETNSNNILKNMVVFPDNAKTWLIGDGYIENPYHRDPYYVGPMWGGYYMGTDIGYLRFLFYFGIFGLATFIIYFFKVANTCVERFPKYAAMFWFVLAINMIVWLKVSTDVFVVFALFLCISQEDNDAYENSISDPLDI